MLSNKHAGAEVARPLLSQEDVSFDAAHPLQSFLRATPRARRALAQCQAASFWWSIPNLAPKLALEKVALVAETETELVFQGSDGAHRILPLADRTAYWHAILKRVEAKTPLALLPAWAAQRLKKHYKIATQQSEYLIATPTLRELPGGSLRNVRNLIHRARREVTVGRFDGDHVEDYFAVNKAWYRQNAEAKFRTYDKTSIDWMLVNWRELSAAAPDLQCFGARDPAGRLIAFTISSVLCDGVWSAYTERFDREHPLQGCNWLLWQDFANFYDEPFENDGTADTTALRRNKGKVVASMAQFFKVTP